MAAVVLVYLPWLRDVTETRFCRLGATEPTFGLLYSLVTGPTVVPGNTTGLTIHVGHVARHLIDTCLPVAFMWARSTGIQRVTCSVEVGKMSRCMRPFHHV